MIDAPDYWFETLLECNRRSHSPKFNSGEHNGPCPSSRTFAIFGRAVAEAYFLTKGVPAALPLPRLSVGPVPTGAEADADSALFGAAVGILRALFPKLDSYILQQAATRPPSTALSCDFGRTVALAILADRDQDGSEKTVPYVFQHTRGAHQQDPDNPGAGVHAPQWGGVKHFIPGALIDLDAPPGYQNPGSINPAVAAYIADVKDVRTEGRKHIGETKPGNALIGTYWAYDGTNLLGTPPRLYTQILMALAKTYALSEAQRLFLYATAGLAMGEAGIHSWYNKYKFNIWRPVAGVREHDTNFGAGAEGGSALDPQCDPLWLPLGAPRSNGCSCFDTPSTAPVATAKNFTPPFPAYPSGHASFGTASLHFARRFLKELGKDAATQLRKDSLAFEFTSDEFDGKNTDVTGMVRPRHLRKFPSIEAAIRENGRSRVYLGVHWQFDSEERKANGEPKNTNIGGIPLGLEIAERMWTAMNPAASVVAGL